MRTPSSQAVSRSASASSAAAPSAPTSWRRTTADHGVVVLHPAADDPAVPPGGVAAVAVAVEEVRRVGRVEVERPLLPAHHGRVEGRAAARPRARPAPPAPRRPAAPTRSPPLVEAHLDRADVRERPPDDRLRRAEPPDDVGLRARAEGRQPAPHQLGVALVLGPGRRRLVQPAVGADPGRLVEPPVTGVRRRAAPGPRHRAWSSPTRRSGTRRPTSCPELPVVKRPSSAGTRSRSSRVVRGTPSAIASSTSATHRGRATRPGRRPDLPRATHLATCLRCWTATRAAALPHAAGSRSRGNTKSVRRMASCLTSGAFVVKRGVDVGRRVIPGTRAHSARWTVAASVAWRTVIARVAADHVRAARRTRPCRRASRARRSPSSMCRMPTSCPTTPHVRPRICQPHRVGPRLLPVSNPYGNDPYGQQPQNPYGGAPGGGGSTSRPRPTASRSPRWCSV